MQWLIPATQLGRAGEGEPKSLGQRDWRGELVVPKSWRAHSSAAYLIEPLGWDL